MSALAIAPSPKQQAPAAPAASKVPRDSKKLEKVEKAEKLDKAELDCLRCTRTRRGCQCNHSCLGLKGLKGGVLLHGESAIRL